LRRIVFFSALVAAVLAPSMASAHDGPHHEYKTGLFELVSPTIAAFPGTGTDNVTYVGGSNDFTGGHSAIQGDRLYVGAYGIGMRIFDLAQDPADPVEIGRIVRDGARADVPPDAIDVGDRKFAVQNGTSRASGHNRITTVRTEWFDTTDPENPILLSNFLGSADGESHNGDIVDKRRIWVPSGGSGYNGLRIYDITPTLTTPAGECTPGDQVSDDAGRGGNANPCAPDKLYGSMPPNANDPAAPVAGNPTVLWENSPYRKGRPVGAAFTHTHDVEIYTDYKVKGLGKRDILLLAEGGNYTNNAGNTGSIFVIDITDPADPVALYRFLHEQGGEHHPIRYHHEIQFVDGKPGLALVTDEDLHNGCGGAGGITALQFAPNLQSATEVSEWFIPLGTPAPVCSVHVFSSKNGYVFLGSYNAGLQIVDYQDPANPQQVGYSIQPGATSWGALYNDGYIYVGDMSRGLDVFTFDASRGGGGKKPKGKP
jgi:hypothetical protein